MRDKVIRWIADWIIASINAGITFWLGGPSWGAFAVFVITFYLLRSRT